MYLLILNGALHKDVVKVNLHSIMYLLILISMLISGIHLIKFTFHNVSINSFSQSLTSVRNLNLHSIMYLLILNQLDILLHHSSFTFHNVSINSAPSFTPFAQSVSNLHSIMYLLIQNSCFCSPSS